MKMCAMDQSDKVAILMDAVNDLQIKAGRVFDDDEIEAMRLAYETLKWLPAKSHNRVFEWLRSKLEDDSLNEPKHATWCALVAGDPQAGKECDCKMGAEPPTDFLEEYRK